MRIEKYAGNPILKPSEKNQWENLCVLNPGVIYDDKTGKFVMLYRAAGDDWEHWIRLGLAVSDDGIHFERCSDEPAMDGIRETCEASIEDPRIVRIDGRYYITYAGTSFCPGRDWNIEEWRKALSQLVYQHESAPVIVNPGYSVSYLAYTDDFSRFKRLGRITDSRYDDRDVVLFPEKVGGKFVKISRPKRDDKAPAVWISFSDDLLEWGEPTKLFSGVEEWEADRIGAGCPPIRTEDGWLLIYHGVSGKDHFYRVGMLLLDLNDPTKILARTKDYVMEPEFDYEVNGLWAGCVFPTGIVEKDGLLYIYYGCADRYVAVATVPLADVLEHMKKCRLPKAACLR